LLSRFDTAERVVKYFELECQEVVLEFSIFHMLLISIMNEQNAVIESSTKMICCIDP